MHATAPGEKLKVAPQRRSVTRSMKGMCPTATMHSASVAWRASRKGVGVLFKEAGERVNRALSDGLRYCLRRLLCAECGACPDDGTGARLFVYKAEGTGEAAWCAKRRLTVGCEGSLFIGHAGLRAFGAAVSNEDEGAGVAHGVSFRHGTVAGESVRLAAACGQAVPLRAQAGNALRELDDSVRLVVCRAERNDAAPLLVCDLGVYGIAQNGGALVVHAHAGGVRCRAAAVRVPSARTGRC